MKGLYGFLTSLIILLAIGFYALPGIGEPYKLGLDLHGGVELDYVIDFSDAGNREDFDQNQIIEGLKGVVERRVNSLGTAEPTIKNATYANEAHIIVQLPTQVEEGLSETEQRKKQQEFIDNAKATIGKVVRLEFKELNTTISEADRTARKQIALDFESEITTSSLDFDGLAKKYQDNNENVLYFSETTTTDKVVSFAQGIDIESIANTPYTSPIISAEQFIEVGYNSETGEPNKEVIANGFSVVRVDEIQGDTISYSVLFVNEEPSEWKSAQTQDGRILDEKYLIQAVAAFNPQSFQQEVRLQFNPEGAEIFRELTKRLIGQPMAIFLGGELLTAPTINQEIPNGNAVITGNYTKESAAELATNINTGIVPAPIYLTSENSIDPKLGTTSLKYLMIAGGIGLLIVLIFMACIYRVSGAIAGFSLVFYLTVVLAFAKWFGVVLTLASIAGLVLSIGIAIDANILILERMKDELASKGKPTLTKAVRIGFEKSWSAIWDANITGLITACILYVFGVSLIKGFGLMLGIGIVSSLVVVRYMAYNLTLTLAKNFEKDKDMFCKAKK